MFPSSRSNSSCLCMKQLMLTSSSELRVFTGYVVVFTPFLFFFLGMEAHRKWVIKVDILKPLKFRLGRSFKNFCGTSCGYDMQTDSFSLNNTISAGRYAKVAVFRIPSDPLYFSNPLPRSIVIGAPLGQRPATKLGNCLLQERNNQTL